MKSPRALPRVVAALILCAAFFLNSSVSAANADLDGTTLRYHASSGEANVVTLDLVGPNLVLRDTGAVITVDPGDGFTVISPNEVTLPASGVADLDIRLDDLSDSCILSAAITLPASIQGGDGDDVITGGSGDDVIRGEMGINTLDGGGGYDRLVVDVNGSAGVSNGVELNTSDGQRNGFYNFELVNIRGGAGDDRIDVRGMPAGAAFDIEGNDGDDILTVAGRNGVARGGTGSNRFFVLGTADMVLTDTNVTFDGTETVTFLDVERIVVLDGDDGHLIDASATTGALLLSIEGNGGNDDIRGGAGDDAIRAGTGSNTIDGGGGNDILIANVDGSAILTDTTLEISNTGADAEMDYIVNIERIDLRGGPNDDFMDASATTGTFQQVALEGNDGNDTFVTGSNGSVGMYGKNGDDTYYISENWGQAGIVESSGNDILDFSGLHPVTTDLTVTLSPSGIYSASSGANSINFSSGPAIETIIGGSGMDTLIGANQSNTWNLTANNNGSVGSVAFSSFENLSGGHADDLFVFANGVSFSGHIDGDASLDTFGNDTIDWRAFTTPPVVTVIGPGTKDGEQGTASNLGLGFDNINQLLQPASNCGSLVFEGFLPPIGGADATGGSFDHPLKTFKLNKTIPIKFKSFCGGDPTLTGTHTLAAIKWTDVTNSEPAIDATPTDAATTGNRFRLVGDQWHFNLDTEAVGMDVGIWQLIATLSDGSQHSLWIQIK